MFAKKCYFSNAFGVAGVEKILLTNDSLNFVTTNMIATPFTLIKNSRNPDLPKIFTHFMTKRCVLK